MINFRKQSSYMNKTIVPISVWFMSFLLVGCTTMCQDSRKEMVPEKVVESYLDISFNMNDISQRDLLLEYTTGNLKNAIKDSSDELITSAYIDKRYTVEEYTVVERRDRTPRETEITFSLKYYEHSEGQTDTKNTPLVTTENTVQVVKEKGFWYIQDVLGNKTTIDFPISEDSRITAKAPE